jgi:hypothetical protein
MVCRYTDTASQSRKPSIRGDHLNGVAAGCNDNSGTRVVLVGKPIELSFDAEDEGAHLPIATNLAAAGKDSVVGRKGESIASGVGKAAPIPCGTSVSTNIDAGPTEWRRDRYEGSRRPWGGGHRKISCESLPADQSRRQRK